MTKVGYYQSIEPKNAIQVIVNDRSQVDSQLVSSHVFGQF